MLRKAGGALAVLALVAGVTTVLSAHFLFPHGTENLDEVAYEAQANALRAGELTLPAATHAPVFLPYLAGVRSGRVVFKYQPEWPAAIAASDAVFGTSLVVLVLLSIAGVWSVAWLAWELVRDARVAIVAGALVVLSPFTWVQTASLLGYQLSFVLGASTAAALLGAARTKHLGVAAGAGALFGLAVFHRPFDALIATAPVLVYCVWRCRREPALPRLALAFVAGGLPFAAVLFAYNADVTGSPLRLPYSTSGAIDTFGFGWRASFQILGGGRQGQIHYTLGDALATQRHLLATFPRFLALAPAVLICFGVAVWARRRDARLWLLVAMVVTTLVAYFFWWGSANEFHFRLENGLGPFYAYTLLIPICVGAAWGLFEIHWRPVLVGLAIAGVAWSLVTSVGVLRDARDQGDARTQQLDALGLHGRQLVFVAPEFPNDPYVRYPDDADLHGARLVGMDIPGRLLGAIDRAGGRAVFEQRLYHRRLDPLGAAVLVRVPLTVVRGRVLVANAVRADRRARLYLRIGDRVRPVPGPLVIDASLLPSDGSVATVAIGAAPGPVDAGHEWYECRFEARRLPDGAVEALTPCDGYHHYVFPGGAATAREDLAGLLDVRLVPAVQSPSR